MQAQIWNERYKITSYQVDFQSKIKPSHLMQLFQESAGNHADHLGAGYLRLMEEGMFWALSRLKVEIEKLPLWGEEIRIETWPCSLVGPYFRRDFHIYDESGALLARGVSGWLLLNAGTMRPQRADRLMVELPMNEGRKAMEAFPDRISSTALTPSFRKTLYYNEIDVNNHVNNTRYLDWVMDCFDADFYRSHELKSFALEFLGEMHWGDEVELRCDLQEDFYAVHAVDQLSQRPAFKAELQWQ
ncbi:MAG: thioesterase [Marinilabiliales bacterium]|nr:thioesterase [Marinilabiliales bacterium]